MTSGTGFRFATLVPFLQSPSFSRYVSWLCNDLIALLLYLLASTPSCVFCVVFTSSSSCSGLTSVARTDCVKTAAAISTFIYLSDMDRSEPDNYCIDTLAELSRRNTTRPYVFLVSLDMEVVPATHTSDSRDQSPQALR